MCAALNKVETTSKLRLLRLTTEYGEDGNITAFLVYGVSPRHFIKVIVYEQMHGRTAQWYCSHQAVPHLRNGSIATISNARRIVSA